MFITLLRSEYLHTSFLFENLYFLLYCFSFFLYSNYDDIVLFEQLYDNKVRANHATLYNIRQTDRQNMLILINLVPYKPYEMNISNTRYKYLFEST